MKTLTRLFLVLVLQSAIRNPHSAIAQPPARLPATNLTVMVNPNGVLLNPTNLFHANRAALNAEVTNSPGNSQPAAPALSNVVNGLSNTYFGSFTGNGVGLSNLNAAQLATGTIPDAVLSSNVLLLTGPHTMRGLFFSTTPAANTNTSETVVYTNTLPANTLAAEGDSLEGWFAGFSTNNAATKTVRVYLGATLILSASPSANNVAWRYDFRLLRGPSATNQVLSVFASTGTSVIYNSNAGFSENLASNLGFGVTLTGSVGTGDITLRGLKLSKFPAN